MLNPITSAFTIPPAMREQHFSLVLVYNVFSKTGAPDNNINLKHLCQTTRDRVTIHHHSPLLCISVPIHTNTHSSITTSWRLLSRDCIPLYVTYNQQSTVREEAPSVVYANLLYLTYQLGEVWVMLCV